MLDLIIVYLDIIKNRLNFVSFQVVQQYLIKILVTF